MGELGADKTCFNLQPTEAFGGLFSVSDYAQPEAPLCCFNFAASAFLSYMKPFPALLPPPSPAIRCGVGNQRRRSLHSNSTIMFKRRKPSAVAHELSGSSSPGNIDDPSQTPRMDVGGPKQGLEQPEWDSGDNLAEDTEEPGKDEEDLPIEKKKRKRNRIRKKKGSSAAGTSTKPAASANSRTDTGELDGDSEKLLSGITDTVYVSGLILPYRRSIGRISSTCTELRFLMYLHQYSLFEYFVRWTKQGAYVCTGCSNN